jgi:hypothetical protein
MNEIKGLIRMMFIIPTPAITTSAGRVSPEGRVTPVT